MLFIGILPNQNILICWYNDILTRADEAESISHAFLSIVCVCVCVCVCVFFLGGGGVGGCQPQYPFSNFSHILCLQCARNSRILINVGT